MDISLPIVDYLNQVSMVLGSISTFDISRVAEILCKARMLRARVWLVGNGGSAATASHFSNDLQKAARVKAFALPDEVPTTLAYGNDNGWDHMFSDALEPVFETGDVLVAISCSGRSQNVICAAQTALAADGYLIILTGERAGNPLADMNAHAVVAVNNPNIRIVEDCHLAICHAVIGILENVKVRTPSV